MALSAKRWFLGVVFLSIMATGRPVWAATISFTSLDAFNDATSDLTTITFEGLAPTDSFTFFTSPPGLTISGVNFQASTGSNNLFVIDPGLDPDFNFPSGQFLQNNIFAPGSGIVATLPAGITAVGADVSAQDPPNANFTMTVTVTDGGIFTFPFTIPTRPELSFVGFTSDVPISSVQFSSSAGGSTIDNVRFGTAEIPEPASLFLLGSGVVALAARHYRRRRS